MPETVVPDTTPVITIDGVCDITTNGTPRTASTATAKTPATGTARSAAHTGTAARARTTASESASSGSSSGGCKTLITRAEFEKLMKAVAPGAPPQAWRQIATRYVQFLTQANEAVKLGIDKEPEFPEQLAIVRLQFLAQSAERKLQAQATNVSEAEQKTYYDQNPSAFEQITLTRLYVPATPAGGKPANGPANPAADKQAIAPGNAPDSKPETAAPDTKAIADNARQQLLIGGDPEKIEKGVYEQLKNTNPAPSTKFGDRRRGASGLPAAQEEKLFAMKDGDISDVVSDPSGGYVVYRVEEKKELPFDKVKEEIKQRIARQRITDTNQQIQSASKADYNDSYFGPEAPPRTGPMGAAPQGSRPGGLPSGSIPPPRRAVPPSNVPAEAQSTPAQSSPPSTPK